MLGTEVLVDKDEFISVGLGGDGELTKSASTGSVIWWIAGSVGRGCEDLQPARNIVTPRVVITKNNFILPSR